MRESVLPQNNRKCCSSYKDHYLKHIKMQPMQATSKVRKLKMKQPQHDIEFTETSEKNPSPRWDLNPRPSVIWSDALTTWATGDSMVSKGQFVGLDWNRITRLHSCQVMTGTCELTNSITLSHIKAYQDAANQPPKWVYIKDETTTWYRITATATKTWYRTLKKIRVPETHKLTLAHHGVSSSSVVRASNYM